MTDTEILTPEDRAALERAVRILEHPGFFIRLVERLGRPIEAGLSLLPDRLAALVRIPTRKALEQALNVAVFSLGGPFAESGTPSHGRAAALGHKCLAGFCGAAGGAFGLPALALELPLSTTLILRAIAAIARGEGEDIHAIEGRLACLEVFALGGRARKDPGGSGPSDGGDAATDSAYFAVRAALAKEITEAAEYLAVKGLTDEGAPVLVRFIGQLAARYGIVVSEKVAAQAVPVVGAVSGGFINLVFMDHFQDMARGHFTVRRLERRYGPETVRRLYMDFKERRGY